MGFSIQNTGKIKVWSKIINNSNCELYLKNSGGYNKEIYDNLLKRFENEDVDLKKIIFLKHLIINKIYIFVMQILRHLCILHHKYILNL